MMVKKSFIMLLVFSLTLSLAAHVAWASGYETSYSPVLNEYADFVLALENGRYSDYYDYIDITCDILVRCF